MLTHDTSHLCRLHSPSSSASPPAAINVPRSSKAEGHKCPRTQRQSESPPYLCQTTCTPFAWCRQSAAEPTPVTKRAYSHLKPPSSNTCASCLDGDLRPATSCGARRPAQLSDPRVLSGDEPSAKGSSGSARGAQPHSPGGGCGWASSTFARCDSTTTPSPHQIAEVNM